MEISILVPAWNNYTEVERFAKQVEKLDATTYLIVGPKADYEKARKLVSKKLHVLQQESPNKNLSLQKAYEKVKTSHILLTDIDARFNQEWLDKMKDENVVTTWFKPLKEEMKHALVYHHYQGQRIKNEGKVVEAEGICGACTLLPTSVIQDEDFDPKIKTGTDYVLGQNLLKRGVKIKHIDNPIEVSYHHKLIPYIRQQRRWIKNLILHSRKSRNMRDLLSTTRSLSFSLLFWTFTGFGYLNPYLLTIPGAMMTYGVIRRTQRGGRPFSAAYHVLAEQTARGLAILDIVLPWRRDKW